jgi:lipopolysaccharide/colanic/teichoic acid biosynthesis glycosyltransferase
MEPNISATPSSPVADANGRPVVNEPRPIAGENGLTANGAANGSAAILARTNGRTNGHGSAHSNGHAHARVAVDTPARGGTAWRPLAGPVRAGVSGGYAAAPSAATAVTRDGFYQRYGKRALDVVGAVIALVLSAPVMLLAALAIKIETHGPVLYRSTRVGRGGKPFTFYKLRSMVNGADRHRHHLSHLNECDGPVFKISRDPRVTVVGRFLRTTSLDELPQLWNVLRGDMSLVGPRPPIPDEVSHYQPWQMRRLEVRPGLTCLWQISGRSRIGFEEWMRLDLEYIQRRSFRLDFRILLRTIPAVISREGAY